MYVLQRCSIAMSPCYTHSILTPFPFPVLRPRQFIVHYARRSVICIVMEDATAFRGPFLNVSFISIRENLSRQGCVVRLARIENLFLRFRTAAQPPAGG